VTISAEVVRQEVSELHRLIQPLVKLCTERRPDFPTYNDTSREFFMHIGELGRRSLTYLQTLPTKILNQKYSQIAASNRQKLLQLKSDWENLHQYIQPALDADTLHLPTPLIAALHERLHEIGKWRAHRFTLFHASEVNYFEVPSGIVRRVANGIASQVGGKPFPKFLGLIGIPYSQANGLFLNCALAHEMGHFIFQENEAQPVQEKVDDALERMLTDLGVSLDEEQIPFCRDLINSWVEETFCDLFATCLIGPAYSFSFSQLVMASMLIGQRDGEPADFYRFEWEHPAEVARFYSHRKMLERLGWWAEIQDWSSAPVEVLRICDKPTSSFFTVEVGGQLPQTILQDRLLQCYNEVCDWLVNHLPSRVKGSAKDVAEFKMQSPIISDYLRRAIVPSTIIAEGRVEHPRPVVLINAGFQFWLENLPLLLTNIKGEPRNSIESRSRIGARLELWLLKALEDYPLLTKGDS
jgi:hypothetical protein